MSKTPHSDRLLVQIASYNTNLQGVLGLPQNLVDWLSPTLQVSSFLSRERRAPDIVAVGFQELLPLHLGLSGLSKSVIDNKNALILSHIEANAPNKESYSLVAKVVNVGVALLVYARDDGLARRVCDVQTRWAGCGIGYMGNKGAVGVRFRVPSQDGGMGETFTFVCAHLTPFEEKLPNRIADYKHIVGNLLFSPDSPDSPPSTIYSTSHLFLLGDFNFRLEIPPTHPLFHIRHQPQFAEALSEQATREELKEFDQLLVEKRKGNVFVGLHEGEFWRFKCSYKYQLGRWINTGIPKRTPSWTDRILYATYTDSPETPEKTNITNILYTAIPSYTTSDHKPIVSLLLLPAAPPTPLTTIPHIRLPPHYTPTHDPRATFKRCAGRVLDRSIGIVWWLFTLIGAGSVLVGAVNFFLGMGALRWWGSSASRA
ncbi:inositol polyphosphate phosphatase [Infundibulicybe gibba]|nr:inositol polyphosphate phosphatase [Infundibulicybe gibba]